MTRQGTGKAAADAMAKAKRDAANIGAEDGVLAILREEHAELSSLMTEVSSSSDDEDGLRTRQELFPEIRAKLLAHTRAEEKEFYSVLQRFGATAELASDSIEDHDQIEELLRRIELAEEDDPQWIAMFKILHDRVEEHVRIEENQLFPLVRRVLSEDSLREMKDRFNVEHNAEMSLQS